MPLYTCYPRRPDGISPAFETRELVSDAHAVTFAAQLFDEFPNADKVEIWQGPRLVMIFPRARPIRIGAASRSTINSTRRGTANAQRR